MSGEASGAQVAVVTVSYRSADVLAGFLASVPAATTRRVEVVVADNAAPDPDVASVVEDAARAGLTVRHLGTGGNVGYGRAANAGAAATSAPWLVVANPDLVWDAGALDLLLDAAARWPRGGAFGPLICTPEGQTYPSARELPSLGRGAGHALAGWWWPANPWTAAYRREREAPTERAAGWLSGSCLLVRRVAFDAVGGFDPSYFMYFEDVDLGDRLGRAGWRNVYVPRARVVHAQGHAADRDPASRARTAAEHHRSAYRYLARRHAGARWAPVRLGLRAGLVLRAVAARRVRSVAEGAALQR